MSGVFIVLGASAAWGFGSVLSHRLPVPAHAMLAAAIEMLAGGVVLLAVAAATGEFSRVHWSAVPATSWIALAYLIGPGSILAFTAYGYALSHLPVATVSTYAYVNPVVAVLAGIVFLGEQFSWREGLGAALVLASVIIILNRPRHAHGAATRHCAECNKWWYGAIKCRDHSRPPPALAGDWNAQTGCIRPGQPELAGHGRPVLRHGRGHLLRPGGGDPDRLHVAAVARTGPGPGLARPGPDRADRRRGHRAELAARRRGRHRALDPRGRVLRSRSRGSRWRP